MSRVNLNILNIKNVLRVKDLNIGQLKAHSHGTIFCECDSIFLHCIEWVVWM